MLKFVDNFAIVKKKGDDLQAVASTASIDRDGEKILPTAFQGRIETFRANPVLMANHLHRSDSGRPTIIGSAENLEVTESSLLFNPKFASTPLAQEWKTLFDEGHARAFSVGFIPIKGEMIDDTFTHTEVELLEISAVSVPSNREALMREFSEDDLSKIAEMLSKEKAGKELETLLLKMKRQHIADDILEYVRNRGN